MRRLAGDIADRVTAWTLILALALFPTLTLMREAQALTPAQRAVILYGFPVGGLTCAYTPITTGTQGVAYTGATPSASGGTPSYSFSETGSLPTGLSINSSTGVISGTPSVSGSFPGIQVQVTDSASNTANCGSSFTLVISASGGNVVTLDAVSTALVDRTNASPYTGTANITVGSGSAEYLIAILKWDSLVTATTCHWDSTGANQSMTSLGAATNSAGAIRVELFGVASPTAGNKTINCTWTGTGNEMSLFAISYTNVASTANFNSASGTLAGSGTTNFSVTSQTNDAVVTALVNDFTVAATCTNQTQLYSNNGTALGKCGSRSAGAATVTTTFTNGTTGDNYAAVGIDLVHN